MLALETLTFGVTTVSRIVQVSLVQFVRCEGSLTNPVFIRVGLIRHGNSLSLNFRLYRISNNYIESQQCPDIFISTIW